MGFSVMEEAMLNMIGAFVQLKLHELLTLRYSKQIMKNDRNLIRIAGELSTQRSYADLIITLKSLLPIYFDF